jgi:hypothetical protein
MISAKIIASNGAISLGFSTIVQPAASAGATLQAIWLIGQFQGVILRGRMTGVNMVFFTGGPQLGQLRAGLLAQWLGPMLSVVSGGVGCLLVTAVTAAGSRVLRRYRLA